MDERSVEVLVIGAGSAGLNAVRELQQAEVDWLLVEAERYGTTCARVGCMPSKLLIAAADAAAAVDHAEAFGIEVGGREINGNSVLERVQRERARFVSGVVEQTEELPEERRLMGAARFEDENTVVIGDEVRISADAVVIAAGSRPIVPDVFEDVRDRVLTSDSIFDIDGLPKSMAVVGAGAIGLELGQALARLGVDTTIFDIEDAVAFFTDPVVRDYATKAMHERLSLRLGTTISAAKPDGDDIALTWKDGDDNEDGAAYESVLLAVGRTPNLDTLDLDAAGIDLDEEGRPCWDPRTTQVGDRPVFIAGDANEACEVLHEATDEGRIAGRNAAHYPDVTAHVRRTPLRIAFTDPQMAIAGNSFSDLDPDRIECGEVCFDEQGRATVIDEAVGIVRLYAERETCLLRGAELFGPRMEHMAHLIAWSVGLRATVQQLLGMPFYHPVLEEGLRTGLRDLAKALRIAGECRAEDFATSSGG